MSTTFFFRSGEIELPEEPARLRSHAALVRGLVDEIERIAPVSVRSSEAAVFAEMGEQLAEEVARLGYRMLECAAAIVRCETLGVSGALAADFAGQGARGRAAGERVGKAALVTDSRDTVVPRIKPSADRR
jgi:hypothetical protein